MRVTTFYGVKSFFRNYFFRNYFFGRNNFCEYFFGYHFFYAIFFLFKDYFLVVIQFGGKKSNFGLLFRDYILGAFFLVTTFLGEYILEHEKYLQDFSSNALDKK